jgi:hypothetical protein
MRRLFGKHIREIVDDAEWQALRGSLVGRWKGHPDACLAALKKYGGDLRDPMRVARLLNYLTGSGFRTGKLSTPKTAAYLLKVRAAYQRAKEPVT